MKILTKLLAGYTLIALVTCVVGYLGIRANREISHEFTKISEEVLPVTSALEDIRFSGLRIVSSSTEIAYLMTKGGETEQEENELDLIESGEKRYREAISRYRTLTVGGTVLEVQQLEAVHEAGEKLLHSSRAFVAANKNRLPITTLLEKKEAFEQDESIFMDAVSKALHEELRQRDESRRLVEETISKSQRTVLAATGFSMILSILIGSVISLGISRPIRRLKVATDRIGKGELQPITTDFDPRSEIGALSVAFNQMVVDLKRAHEGLVSSEAHLDNIIRSMVDSLIIVSPSGEILTTNPATLAMLDFGIDELIGQPFSTILENPDLAFLLTALHDGQGDIREMEGSFRTRQGESIPVLLAGSNLKSHGTEDGELVFLAHNISNRKQAEQEIHQLAFFDQLTGLPNRTLFMDRLNQALAHAQREKHFLAILFLDLDRFKDVNDTLGHARGDLLLQQVAMRLASHVRKSDTLARLGGDEFVILVNSAYDEHGVSVLADKVLADMKDTYALEDNEIFTSASIGIVLYPLDGQDAGSLLKNADMAMYAAKEKGRSNYQFFSDNLNRKANERSHLSNSLRRALQDGQFTLHYQPQFDLVTGRTFGVEALLRWNHPDDGFIPPDRFIPVAEQTGMIRPIGEWVLRTACQQAIAWMRDGYPALRVAVNISAQQFVQKGFVTQVSDILKETGLDPASLELELTESILMEGANDNITILHQLKMLGVHLAIDDFGTGYSSLSYLKHFPIDCLKIDKSFVRDITNDHGDSVIVDAIIAMGHSLDLRVLAEGVETETELSFLRSRGCDEVQGYHFARPMPADEVKRFLTGGTEL